MKLKKLFVTTGIYGNVTSGEYPLITSFVKEINADSIHNPPAGFRDIFPEYFLPMSSAGEVFYNDTYNNTKLILKDFFQSILLRKGTLSVFNNGISDLIENLYISGIDLSSLNYTAPFGLPGFTSSLFEYDGNSSYKMYSFSSDLSTLRTDNITLSYPSGGASSSITLINENNTTTSVNIPQFVNTTCSYSGYFKGTFYPATKIVYNGNFTVNTNLDSIFIFPEYGKTSDSYFTFETFGVQMPIFPGNYTVNTYSYIFNETLPEPFVLTVAALDDLLNGTQATLFQTIMNGTELHPVIDFTNPDGYSSFYAKIEALSPFTDFSGIITSNKTVTSNSTGILEGITPEGKFIKVKTPISVSGNYLSFDLNPSLLSRKCSIDYSLSNGTLKMLINVDPTIVDFCDIDFLSNSTVKDYSSIDETSPIGEYFIIKGAKEPLYSVKKIPSSVPFLETSAPDGTKYIKVLCYNSQRSLEIGKVFKLNSEIDSYTFKPLAKTGKLNIDVFKDSVNFTTNWDERATIVLSNNKTVEFTTSDKTLPLQYLINMAPDINGYAVNYNKGEREDIYISVNIVGSETAYALSSYSGFDIILTWDPTSFNATGTCKFNIIDSNGGSANDTWSLDYTNGTYTYQVPQIPDFVYAARFCKFSDGNFSVIAKIFKPIY